MFSKSPKNTSQYHWTNHVKFKMQYYGLSAQKILGVISRPARKEEGIAEKTVAVMQPVSPKTINNKTVWKSEVWAMYQDKKKEERSKKKAIKIISAWRYPGVSPKRNPIPEDILSEIAGIM
ncbi:MAG: hypothetical protein WCV59_02160 [Parcubacteria group bacterium]|jgi:hypothetical protein